MKSSRVKESIKSISEILKINISISKQGFLLVAIISLITSILPSIQLLLTEKIGIEISSINSSDELKLLIFLLILQSGILIAKTLLDLLCKIVENNINTKVFFFMESSIKRKLLKIKMSLFEDSEIYNQIQIASRVAPQFGLNLFKNILLFIQTAISLILITYTLRNIPLLAVVMLISLSFVNILMSRMFNKTQLSIYHATSEDSRKRDELSDLLMNRNIANEIRMYKVGNFFLEEWQKMFWKIENPQLKLTNKRNVLYHSLLIITQLIQLTVLTIEVARNSENLVGTFLLITQAILLFQSHSSQLIECYNQINQITIYLPSYFNVLALPEENAKNNPQTFSGLEDKIKVKNLYFKYKNSDAFALKNLNFEISKGDKVAIV
ncbi:ABC transporter ATP-binding protein, partial [Mesorhizobium sp. M00.F.Ca.ET.186.01.1.1]